MEIQKAVLYIKKRIGSVVPGEVHEENGYYKFPVQYNPSTLSLSNSSDVRDDEQAAGTKKGPTGHVSINSKSVLSCQLIFESGEDSSKKDYVRDITKEIRSLMLDSELNDVIFSYGKLWFRGELNSVDTKYTMFDSEGNPIWAVVSVSMTEKEEKENEKGHKNPSEKKPEKGTSQYKYATLCSLYGKFKNPVAVIKVNQKDISENKSNLSVSEIEVDLTSGFEASVASFSIYNSFDKDKASFRTDDIKKYILLGSSVSISMGYEDLSKIVFRGFIAKVNFIYEEGEIPHVQVICMDVKAAMMTGSYARQLTSAVYGDAVKEIFAKSKYSSMKERKIITDISVEVTPDNRSAGTQEGEDDRTIEMVNESDYEFVVRAAKKFNYEFFVECGVVLFRRAKPDNSILIDIKFGELLKKFDIDYDITGIVEKIHVRGMDTGKMKLVKSKVKFNNKISMGNKSKQLIKGSETVCIDPTIKSSEDADYRGEYLLEDMSYRFGTLNCECIGIPELKPGYFINIKGLGQPADNRFYITNVKHTIDSEGIFISDVTAKASSIQ